MRLAKAPQKMVIASRMLVKMIILFFRIFLKTLLLSNIPDPRIDKRVNDIYRKIRSYNANRDRHNDGLNHGEISVIDGLDGQPADTRISKDLLGDHGTAHQMGDMETENRHNGDEGIPEGMLDHNDQFAKPLCPGCLDVIHIQDLQHARSCDSRKRSHLESSQGERGQDEG